MVGMVLKVSIKRENKKTAVQNSYRQLQAKSERNRVGMGGVGLEFRKLKGQEGNLTLEQTIEKVLINLERQVWAVGFLVE